MKHLGLIGYPLGHSFSAKYFSEKFTREAVDADYRLYEIAAGDDKATIEAVRRLDGFNVTSPYKEAIIPYLDGLDETARTVGAVNVVQREGEHWTGYNTDCVGFREDLLSFDNLTIDNLTALILGTGGAAKAVAYALRQLGVPYTMVSRTPEARTLASAQVVGYEDIDEAMMEGHRLIVNCTPLGMGAQKEVCAMIPYQWIGSRHFLYDCIYNPAETLFLRKGRAQGAHTRNGLGMLTHQAEAAWNIWQRG
ncbi:MAG: shikimate dehydrogenase family protein [Paludibacteraceae bacterium]